jgi:glycogen operon protein
MLSQGVPMLVAGDEFRRTQNGNNNAYCQDNDISWLDWGFVEEHSELVRFSRCLIEFRRNQPTVRRQQFLSGMPNSKDGLADVSWYSPLGTAVDWYNDEHPIICMLAAPTPAEDPGETGRDVLLMLNSSGNGCRFLIPTIAKSKKWRLFVDTSLPTPHDVYPNLDGPALPSSGSHTLPHKSLAVYVADR